MPSRRATSSPFFRISILRCRVGAMFTPASVRIMSRPSMGDSKTATWLRIREGWGTPVSLLSTALSSMAVDTSPFMMNWTSPSRNSFTASKTARASSVTCSFRNREMSSPRSSAMRSVSSMSPRSTGSATPRSKASTQARSTNPSADRAMATFGRVPPAPWSRAARTSPSMPVMGVKSDTAYSSPRLRAIMPDRHMDLMP